MQVHPAVVLEVFIFAKVKVKVKVTGVKGQKTVFEKFFCLCVCVYSSTPPRFLVRSP